MTVKIRLVVVALLAWFTGQAIAAETASRTEIDRALRVLLADYDVQDHLDIRYAEEVATGFYEVRAGDTLDGIINRAIQGSRSVKKCCAARLLKRTRAHFLRVIPIECLPV